MSLEDKRRQTRENQRRYRQNAREWKKEYLTTHSCVDCGEKDFRCLDFDHVRGVKKVNISILIRRGQTLKSILQEVAKCDVRCANCHRKRTYDNMQISISDPR